MDWNTVAIIITLIGCFVSLTVWLSNRDKKVGSDSEWKGMITAKLDAILGINKRIDGLEEEVKEHSQRITKVETKIEEHIRHKTT